MNKATYKDCFNMLCGPRIGGGISREVFECKLRPELVVKVEREALNTFSNVFECRFWDEYHYTKEVRVWLAPCEFLSPDGRLLLQRRAKPIPEGYSLPKKLPEFLTDVKIDNFGILDGKLVCVDYASVEMDASIKLKEVHWE